MQILQERKSSHMLTNNPELGLMSEVAQLDRLFAEPKDAIADFNFGEQTAAVFDNLLNRSVPFYQEIQRMTGEIAAEFAAPGTALYDLGCSTGTTLLALDKVVDPGVHFVGVDNSEEMLQKAREKMELASMKRSYDLMNADLNGRHIIQDASVVTLILTLQFVRPLYRAQVLESICQGLKKNGCLILVEKVTTSHTLLNRMFIDFYYDFKKRNHYSDLEIAQKREALENVLIPYRSEENRELLLQAGFQQVEEFFRWYNFTALVAVKG